MKELNKNHVGLMLGLVLALWHVAWSILVFLGFAKLLLDWIYWLHFLSIPFTVQPFEITRALLLIVVTFIVGYVMGFVAAWVWNILIKRSK